MGCVYVLHLQSVLPDLPITGSQTASDRVQDTWTDLRQQQTKDQQSHCPSLPMDQLISLVAVVLTKGCVCVCGTWKAILSYAYPLPFGVTKLNRLHTSP